MFTVEMMFAKMVLPKLGGSPSVWNTCLVFYQAVLMAGYIYAHLSLKWLGPRRQAVFHILLLSTAWISLPIGIGASWIPPAEGNPAIWLLGLLAACVGLPFLCISASAPLLQSWFSYCGGRSAKDPYFLYAASNLGSLAGLAAYPLVIEPALTLRVQTLCWSAGYGLLMALFAICAAAVWVAARRQAEADPASLAGGNVGRSKKEGARRSDAKEDNPYTSPTAGEAKPDASLPEGFSAPVTWLRRLWWLALSMAPSAMLMGVTAHLSLDIASFPLLWAVPLGLYLLSFIFVFARWPILKYLWLLRILQAVALTGAACTVYVTAMETKVIVGIGALHLAAFFLTALVCHGAMAADRPASEHLTEFYLWMSAGGVVGGLLCALVAPLVFNTVMEYPLMLVAACLLGPRLQSASFFRGRVGRGTFWTTTLCLSAISLVVGFVAANIDSDVMLLADVPVSARVGIVVVWACVVSCISLSVQVRRWHDIGYSGWMVLINFIPLGSLACLVVLGFFRGADGPNAYGESVLPLQSNRYVWFWRCVDVAFAVAAAAILFVSTVRDRQKDVVIYSARSFFSVLRVEKGSYYDYEGTSYLCHVLMHGTTDHGQQSREADASGRPGTGEDALEPCTYFDRTGPVGDVFEARNSRRAFRRGGQIGVVGLGTGTIASYILPGQSLTYFEIDAAVREIADNPKYFTFLSNCREKSRVDPDIRMGDARLTLDHDEFNGKFDLLVIDAFSSDAIPVHLLTKEAMEMYFNKLAPGGMLMVHVSNRHLRLEPVVGGAASALHKVARIRSDDNINNGYGINKAESTWAVLADKEEDLGPLKDNLDWEPLKAEAGVPLWTDDYSSIVSVMHWNWLPKWVPDWLRPAPAVE
jgi:uncharacterized membrane protein YhaH (DUF805 family)/spermidine synthase